MYCRFVVSQASFKVQLEILFCSSVQSNFILAIVFTVEWISRPMEVEVRMEMKCLSLILAG